MVYCGYHSPDNARLNVAEDSLSALYFQNNIGCAYQLSHLSKPVIQMLGGQLNRINMSTYSRDTYKTINQFHFDIAFFGTTAYDTHCGFTGLPSTYDDCRNLIMERSMRNVVLMDSTKVGPHLPIVSFDINRIDTVICDDGLDSEAA